MELEDKYHDPDDIVSMGAIEHELKYTDVLLAKYKNSPDEYEFFEMKKESL